MNRRDMDAGEVRRIANRLREITQAVCETTGQPDSLGLLGGAYGYGADFENDTFSIMPFYWDDCTCGWEERYDEWHDANPHAEDCYQSELRRRGYWNYPKWDDFNPGLPSHDETTVYQLAREWELPEQGCAIHCTCGLNDRSIEWQRNNLHPIECPVVRPNFHYKPTGTMIWWYKYIGRGMDWNGIEPTYGWENVCIESVEDNE